MAFTDKKRSVHLKMPNHLHFSLGIITLVALVATLYSWRKEISNLSTGVQARLYLAAGKSVLAFFLGAITGVSQLYNPATFKLLKPEVFDTSVWWAYIAAIALLIFIITLEVLNAWVKEVVTDTTRALKSQITILEDQRDWFIRSREVIGEIIEHKMSVLRDLWAGARVHKETKLADSFDPVSQIKQILVVLHLEFKRRLHRKDQLRLGVYLPDIRGDKMEIFFGWDGTKEDCFSTKYSDFMKIDEPEGPKSLITRLYHDRSTNIHIVPDCESEKNFYFDIRQREYLRSMVAVKKQIITSKKGKKSNAILTLDTSKPNFFLEADKENIALCCEEILKRLEFELLVLQIVEDTDAPTEKGKPQ